MPSREQQKPRPVPREEEDSVEKQRKSPFKDLIDESKDIIEEAEKQQQKGRRDGQ